MSLREIANKDQWTWQDFCRAHAYNTGEDIMSMEKRAVVQTEQEKKAHEQAKKTAEQVKKDQAAKPGESTPPKKDS